MAIQDLWEQWRRKVEKAKTQGRKPPNRPKKRWMADTYLGAQRVFRAFELKADAESWAAHQKRKEIHTDLGIRERPRIGFRALSRRFLEEKEKQRTKRTFEFYLHQIRPHLGPFFGDIPVDQIDREHIVRYIHMRLATRYRGTLIHPRAVNKEIATLRRIFKHARINGYHLPEDPSLGIVPMKAKPKKKIRFLQPDEIKAFLEAVKDPRSFTFFLTAIETGMRRNEIWHFRWDWIDWDRGVIRVTHDETFDTKSHEERDIPMTARIRAHLESRPGPREGLVVPPSVNGQWKGKRGLVYRQYQPHLHDAIEDAKLRHFTLHDLRHTYASRLVMRGVALYTVSKLLGHQDIKTTQIYAHLTPDHLKDAVALLDTPTEGKLEEQPEILGK